MAKQLPPILYSTYAVEPGAVDIQRWYPEVESRLQNMEELEKEIREQQAAIDAVIKVSGLGGAGVVSLSGLQAQCDHSLRYTGLQKVDPVVEIISNELRSGAYEKKVIFCIHQAVVEDLREKLLEFNPVILYGRTPPKKRNKREKIFQNDPECKLLIGNIEAAGIVINLTAAHHVDMVESSWVPSQNAQAIMRTHRHGQNKTVNVRFYYIPGTTDMKVQSSLKRKTADLTQIYDPDKEGEVDIFEE